MSDRNTGRHADTPEGRRARDVERVASELATNLSECALDLLVSGDACSEATELRADVVEVDAERRGQRAPAQPERAGEEPAPRGEQRLEDLADPELRDAAP